MTPSPSWCRFPQHDLRAVSAAPQEPPVGLGGGGAWTNPASRKSGAKALHVGCVWTIQPQGLLGAALIYSQAWGALF